MVEPPGCRAVRPRLGGNLRRAHPAPRPLATDPTRRRPPPPPAVRPPLLLGADVSKRIADVLSELGIAGGAVYDALVGLASVEHDTDLATRDRRAKAAYDAVGARVIIAG
jgi:hypothetical protein